MNKIGVFTLIGIFAIFVSSPTCARPQFQDDMSQADGFIFDGPADRPNKFPPNGGNGGRTTPNPWQPTQPIDLPPTPNPGNNNNNNQPAATTQSPQVARCMQTCPVTSEFNPVCGSDGVTYSNPGKLSCAQFCGTQVQTLRVGPCNSQIRGK